MSKRDRELLELIKRNLLAYDCHVEYSGITRGSYVMFLVVHDKTGESRKLFTGF